MTISVFAAHLTPVVVRLHLHKTGCIMRGKHPPFQNAHLPIFIYIFSWPCYSSTANVSPVVG